jgi:hypothetical protein
MKKRLVIVLALILVLIPTGMALAEKPAPSLTGTTEYAFVGHLGEFDPEGRLLVWRGTISGDINGVMLWWMVVPFKEVGQTTHFVARWEIWNLNETVMLLAGDEAGTTTVRHYKNSIWRANGIVTEASGNFADWKDRQMHDGGNVDWGEAPPASASGEGTFRIN